MTIFLLHEKCFYDGDFGHYNVYPYQRYNDVIQRIMDETGFTRDRIQNDLSVGDCCVKAGNFVYEVEETEIL